MTRPATPASVFGADRLAAFTTSDDERARLAAGDTLTLEAIDGSGAVIEAALIDGAVTYRAGVKGGDDDA